MVVVKRTKKETLSSSVIIIYNNNTIIPSSLSKAWWVVAEDGRIRGNLSAINMRVGLGHCCCTGTIQYFSLCQGYCVLWCLMVRSWSGVVVSVFKLNLIVHLNIKTSPLHTSSQIWLDAAVRNGNFLWFNWPQCFKAIWTKGWLLGWLVGWMQIQNELFLSFKVNCPLSLAFCLYALVSCSRFIQALWV